MYNTSNKLSPALSDLIDAYESRYQLVADVAVRARKISRKAEKTGQVLVEKPVTIAMEELDSEIKDKREND